MDGKSERRITGWSQRTRFFFQHKLALVTAQGESSHLPPTLCCRHEQQVIKTAGEAIPVQEVGE